MHFLKRNNFKGNFVDIGGGNGFQACAIQNNFPESKVALIEPGKSACSNAKKRGLTSVHNCFFEDFDFYQFGTNAAGLFDVLEHIENDINFLTRLSHKLPEGTSIYISVPAYHFLWSEVDEHGQHFRRYTKTMILKLAKESNLELIDFSYFFSYLIPFIFLLRVLPEMVRRKRDVQKITEDESMYHKNNYLTLKILNFFHWIEVKLINRKLLPCGASILFVLKKNLT
jgi:hypothetical protein